MAMTAGSVSVSPAGVVTKSGFAEEVYDDLWADYQADAASFPPADAASELATKQGLARAANKAALVITYIQANAVTDPGGDSIL